MREVNEDRFFCEPRLPFYAVLDGCGGRGRGAELAVETLRDHVKTLLDSPARPAEVPKMLRAMVHATNQRLFEDIRLSHHMGSTLTCCVVVEGTVVAAHVGDARLYCCHGGVWRRVTRDHSPLEDPLWQGEMGPADRFEHRNILTRTLGITDVVDVDTYVFDVLAGDCILLCTDGAWTAFDPDGEGTVPSNLEPESAFEWIWDHYARQGEYDNATALLAMI
jgi:protein phosphatase